MISGKYNPQIRIILIRADLKTRTMGYNQGWSLTQVKVV